MKHFIRIEKSIYDFDQKTILSDLFLILKQIILTVRSQNFKHFFVLFELTSIIN